MNNIEQFLKNNNITDKTKGYYYLEKAIQIALSINGRKINPCSDIYPLVAEKFNTTFSAAEKSIRYALKSCEKYRSFTIGKFLNNELDDLKSNYKNDKKYFEMWNKLKRVLESITNANWLTKESFLRTMKDIEKDYENE